MQNNIFVSQEELNIQKEFSEKVHSILTTRFPECAPKAFIHTYGCQGNVADSEHIKGMLVEMGYELCEKVDDADLILYNTCAIREHAEDRVFGNVGALKKLKSEKPHLIIALCGCMMQQTHIAEKIKRSYPFVSLVFGTHVVHKLPELISKTLTGGKRVFCIEDS
ncbi:MAG: tRNA (N6-isopentenyl adenosine(37)-C2)-methylthiotransferase MiaB, partial [Acutalibacteraceae bacterium]|nr:tRNA (N6-isopentenyl adenosine(37)-C2)-methylthiotransferase MiaB [Acutalibacteraceae bacterium]